MPYLVLIKSVQAVIYEGLRMNIPFSGLTMKQVPPEGDTSKHDTPLYLALNSFYGISNL